MANNPRIDIGVRVDYKDVLEQMKSSFKEELTEISNHAKKTSFDADIEKKLKQIDSKVDSTFGNFEKKFDELSNQTIKTENFEEYQRKVSKVFDDVRSSVSSAVDDIAKLRDEVKMLSGADFASGMKKQFEDLCQDVKRTHDELLQVLDVTQSSSGDSPIVKQYSKTLNNIRKMKEEIENIGSQKVAGDEEAIEDQYFAKLDSLDEYFEKYKELKKKLSTLSKEDSEYSKLENDLINQEILIKRTIATIRQLNSELEDISGLSRLDDETLGKIKIARSFDKEIDSFAAKIEKVVSKSKEASEQMQGEFSTFRMKDGAIHIPIDIATNNEELKDRVKEIIEQLKSYVDNTPIIAKVKLTLDKSSSKGYEKNAEVDKQQVEGQNEPAVDITKAIQKTYRDAAREAKQIVKTEIKNIQEEFENVPIKLKPDTDAFTKDLKRMINSSFEQIAKETSGVKVSEELEKLVTNLKEVSSSISGNENFKFGLDEASIERITAAIRDMADMIQRAFGVASNADIAAQWTAIESKFKGVAGEEGKLLKGNKEHKIAIQELAVEYKKYLDMGGKNDLSELTTHKQTVKNIATEYENLGKAAQEAAQKQEKAVKKPKSTKVSSEESEAIKGVTKQNKNLETQAGKTSAALDNEGKSAQSAAEKFRKLAKEKGAAVAANRELAKAAKETADALEREAKIRKETGTKTGKGAVSPETYESNVLGWKKGIKESLLDSGKYEEVYGEKISQAANGVVTFKAYVKDLNGEWQVLTATVDKFGNIASSTLQAATEKQVMSIEKAKIAWEKYVASLDSEDEEGEFHNRAELEKYIQTILEAQEELDKFKIKKVEIGSSGRLSITTEFEEANGQVKTFVANFGSVEELIEGLTDEATGTIKNLSQALEWASGRMTSSVSDVHALYEEIVATAQKLAGLDVELSTANPVKDAKRIPKLTAQYKELEETYTKLMGALFKHPDFANLPIEAMNMGGIFEDAEKAKGIIEIRQRYEELFEMAKKLANMEVKIAGLDSTKNANQLQELISQYKELEDVYTNLFGAFFKNKNVGELPMGSIQDLNDIFEDAKKRIDEINAKLKDTQENFKRGFSSKAQDAFSKFALKHEGNSNWGEVANDFERLRQNIAGIDSQDKRNEFKQNLSDIAAKLNSIGKDNKLGDILGGSRTFKDINEVRANIDSLFASMGKVNEKSIRVKGTDKLTAEVKAANGEIRKMTVRLDSQGFARFVDNGIVQFGRLRAAAEGVFKGIRSMVRIYLSPLDFIRYFRQGFNAVREIDTAMTELRKVSDASPRDITAYFDDAVESAKELGSSVNEMIGATADWQRMGYNLPDSRELGEVAVLYKNVGDGIDVDTANESLVSTIQGFQLQAKDAMGVIDAFNEVSNNYAISSAGIGEALKRSAAAFNAANTDLNQSIALITAGNEIVQSPEKVGTMWQTVSARIRGTKSELEELGESTEDVLSTSKLQSLVKGYTGVDIMKDKDTYKDIYTIVSEIGEKWKDLKDVERAALLEGLAGKKQSNTLAAVLNNADRLKEIYETAEGSAGSAQREQERYTQSLQYSIDQLTAHGEEFWNTFINKDDVKTFINIINILISGATTLVDIFGSIPTVAGILGGFAAIKNFGRPKMFGLKLLV